MPASELGSLLIPGLDMRRAAAMGSDEMSDVPVEMLEPLEEALAESVLVCTLKELRSDGEGSLAIIGVAMESDLSVDLAGALADMIAEEAEFEGDVLEFSFDVYMELTGELVWNMTKGHFDTFEMSGDLALDLYADVELDLEGMSLPMELEGEITGELSLEATAE